MTARKSTINQPEQVLDSHEVNAASATDGTGLIQAPATSTETLTSYDEFYPYEANLIKRMERKKKSQQQND